MQGLGWVWLEASCVEKPGRCKVWVQVWLEAPSFLPMYPCLGVSNPEQMDSSSKLGLGRTFFKVWAGSGTRLLVFIEMKPCPEAFPCTSWTCLDQAGARFGFGSDSRPLVLFRWSLG